VLIGIFEAMFHLAGGGQSSILALFAFHRPNGCFDLLFGFRVAFAPADLCD